jgi:UDP-N-acetylglucosamine 1-carboxyvinyltransferase
MFMVKLRITGKKKLSGEILVSGGKNASMPIIIASLLSKKEITLNNIPFVKDVTTLLSLLRSVGMDVMLLGDSELPKTLVLSTPDIVFQSDAGVEADKIRTSILLIGPALARNGYVKLLKPGGCKIGERKIDFHIAGMKQLGAEVLETDKFVELTTHGKKLKGAVIKMPNVSVGATENLIMAGVLAEGKTVLQNAAIEPEVTDLINFLNQMGAKIKITGEREIAIEGVLELGGGNYIIMPDRIEALTYAMAVCATGGSVLLKNISKNYLKGGIELLEKIGIKFTDMPSKYHFGAVQCELLNGRLSPVEMQTEAYPGFATDLQPQLSVLMLLADGKSEITETIFENRFQHIEHLIKMGGNIGFLKHDKVVIQKTNTLKGIEVFGTDLRACAALAMAGLLADGETIILNAESIDRGYYNFARNLIGCGANIERIT